MQLSKLSMAEQKINVADHIWQVIINPNALAGKCMKRWQEIAAKLDEYEIKYVAHFSNHANAGNTITEHLCRKGERHLMVLGGDGTLNEVINGVCKSGVETKEVFIVPFPVGTGNDWSHTHFYPKDFHALIPYFIEGVFKAHDVGVVKSYQDEDEIDIRYFINIAGFCFDAAVIYETNKGKPRFFTSIIYIFCLIKVLFSYKSKKITIKSKEFVVDDVIFTIAVGICQYNGNGMKQVPMADPFDGWFDVVIIKKISAWKVIANVVNLFSGKHIKLKEVSTFRTDELQISATPCTLGEVEGEMLTYGNYQITMLPCAVNLLMINPKD